MNTMIKFAAIATLYSTIGCCALAQGTAFSYQGRLTDNGSPGTGVYDLRFGIYDAATNGNLVAGPQTNSATGVTNGLFTVFLDFGGQVFTGPNRWLEMAARTNGAAGFSPLAPRQQLTATPYAIYALTASNLSGTLPAAQVSGAIPANQLSGAVGAATNFTGALNGDVTGPQWATVVAAVGGQSAAGVAGSVLTVNAATNAATPGTLVQRDGSGSLQAQDLTLNGNLNLPATSGNVGGIILDGNLFLHAYGQQDLFAGAGAGNLTMHSGANTGIGYYALSQNDAGYNTAVGDYAMYLNSSGFENTANGALALHWNRSGSDNTASGYAALGNNISGPQNAAFGVRALLGNVTGADNTAIGASTLMGNAAGADNTALGYNALAFGSSGNDNVALGSQVLENNSGDNNIAVGFEAGVNLWTGFNNILIGNQGVAGDNGIIRLGTPGLHTNTFVAGAIHGDGGGLTNLNASNITSGELSEEQLPFGVVMNNSFEMATSIALGGNSHVSPDSYFCTALGYGASAEGFYTTALGAGASAVAMYAFAAGNNAYAKDVGAFVWGDASGGPIFYSITNNEFAVRATGGVRFVTGGTGLRIDGLVRGSGFAGDGGGLTNLNAAKLTGSLSNVDNIYLPASDAGKGIIYAGGSPLLQSSGNGNFFAGLNAGNLTMTGPGYNTAIGVTALHNNTSGVADTAVGCEALLANQTGTGNVAVGTDALAANVFGSNNIAVGTAAGGYIQGSFNLDIGNRGLPADNNIIRLGTPGTHTNTFIAGTIFGDGGGLTNLNAATVGGLSIQQNSSGAPNVMAGSTANFVAPLAVGATIGGGGATNYTTESLVLEYVNSVLNDFGTVSGGGQNTAGGHFSTVGGGEGNIASGNESTVSGGWENTASGDGSTVSGGFANSAEGFSSFAAGFQAQATNDGAFVWADTQNANFCSTADNEFSVRAQNGVRIQADKGIHLNAADEPLIVRDWDAFAATAPASKAGIGRWGLFMEPTELTIGIPGTDVPNRYFQIAKYSTNGAATQLVQVDQSGNLTAAGTVTGSSDRNVKEHFNAVNPQEVLARVAAMPVSEWNYKADPATRHIGPMAQDFYAAFAVGLDDRHISMVDADGVALAAIQGLNQKLEDSRRENAQLKARLEKLEQMMTEKLGGAR